MKEVLVYDDTYDIVMSAIVPTCGKPTFAMALYSIIEAYAEALKDIDQLTDEINYLTKELNNTAPSL